MAPKSKSFLWLHWLEPRTSLGIVGTSSARMLITVLQGKHLSLQGACGHCQPGRHSRTEFAMCKGVSAAVKDPERGHC